MWRNFSKVKVVLPDKKEHLIPYIEISDMEANDALPYLMKKFSLEGKYSLFICSEDTKWHLRDDLMSYFCKYIAFMPSGEKSKTSNVNSYLEICEFQDNPINSFSIPICTFDGEYVMDYKCDLHFPFKFRDICYSLSNMFDIDSSLLIPATFAGDIIKEEEMPIDLILYKQVYIAANLSQANIKCVHKRKCILDELMNNETKYLAILKFISSELSPFLQKQTFIPENIIQTLITFFETALIIHRDSLNAFSRNTTSFFSVIGESLMKLAGELEGYNAYVEVFPKLSELITKRKRDDQKFREEWEKIQRNSPNQLLDIVSYLVTPVQRAPNYRSLILRLIEVTPVGHPDSIPLTSALEKMNQLRRQQDDLQKAQTSSVRLSEDLPGVELLNRETYVSSYSVEEVNKNGIILHHLFLMLTTKGLRILDENRKDMFSEEFQYVDVSVQCNEDKCILNHPALQFPLNIKFESKSKASEFEQVIAETTVLDGRAKAHNEPGLGWELVSVAPCKLQRAGMATALGKIFVIGGRDECGIVSSKMYIYDPKTSIWDVFDTPLDERHNLCVCSLNDIIYVYGGVSSNGELDDFWSYNPSTFTWKEEQSTELKGAGLSMTTWRNKCIALTGGNPFMTFIFDVKARTWKQIAKNSIVPPISGHSLVEIQKKLYIVCGALENKLNSCVYSLASEVGKWVLEKSLGLKPIPRVGQIAIAMMHHIWVFGGVESSVPFCFSPIGQWFIFCNEKCNDKYISYAMTTTCIENKDKEFIYLFGGRNSKGISSSLFKLSPKRKEIINHDIIQTMF